MRVLITGGAGFIGSHLADALLRAGHHIRVLDNLSPQVHGESGERPEHLNSDVELIIGDVRDPNAVRRSLDGIDAVYHFSALVGVGQSMYQIQAYTDVNNLGTAVLLEALVDRPIQRLIVASSMSIYGEGLFRTPEGQEKEGQERSLEQLRAGDWEVRGARGEPLQPIPTPERKRPSLASVYALSKYDQERMCLMVGRAYSLPTTALRFFNVYGPRQALSNPYTGVLAIFAARLLNGNAPLIFEDGLQRRDFVSVHDVVQACMLALDSSSSADVFNIGSGRSYTVREIADRIARAAGKPAIQPEITGQYRVGDIRHCFASIDRARAVLGYHPRVTLEAGLAQLAEWLEGQTAADRVSEASRELALRGLTV
ncbi:MAG: NAD-dependent epimerase/dehydratase family protein [Gemmatimonadota bacterium]